MLTNTVLNLNSPCGGKKSKECLYCTACNIYGCDYALYNYTEQRGKLHYQQLKESKEMK